VVADAGDVEGSADGLEEVAGGMARAVEDVLALWREGERLLEALPPTSVERSAIADEVEALRALYRELTDQRQLTTAMLARADGVARDARGVLERARRRLDGPAGSGADSGLA
jgi:hypothetical protein